MRKFALATAAVAALALSVPAFTAPALAQDVKVKIKTGDHGRHHGWRHRDVKKVIIHRDHGRHHGLRHRHHGVTKKIVIKNGNHKTVIKKRGEG